MHSSSVPVRRTHSVFVQFYSESTKHQSMHSRRRMPHVAGRKDKAVIFLDVDGVVLPFDYNDTERRIFPSCTLQALSHVLEQVPNAQLVLSSTWRVQESFIDIIKRGFQLYGGCLGEVDFIDTTDPKLHSERQYEIYEWLSRHEENVVAWIALDDEELLLGEINKKYRRAFEGHVVKTDSHVGMTLHDAKLAVRLLRTQLGLFDA